jgi:hypothetical protein
MTIRAWAVEQRGRPNWYLSLNLYKEEHSICSSIKIRESDEQFGIQIG